MIKKIRSCIKAKKLPWRFKYWIGLIQNVRAYWHNKLSHQPINHGRSSKNKKITFVCGFHGQSGGLYAVASIANLLTADHHVSFVSNPFSNYNPLLKRSIKLVEKVEKDTDVCIVDVSCNHSIYSEIRPYRIPVIVTVHGFLDSLHGLDKDYVLKSVSLPDRVHFVNAVQQQSFQLDEQHYKVIPNTNTPVKKTVATNNVGIVGNLDDPRKNVTASIEIFNKSDADFLHLWSGGSQYVHGNKVIIHQWETDKTKIYNSFDVLLFMGQQETFSLTVIEAMSAGMPCLISSIPAHEQYRDCPGVILVDDGNRDYAHELLNGLLSSKDKLKNEIIRYWEQKYSAKAVSIQWNNLIEEVCRNKLKN